MLVDCVRSPNTTALYPAISVASVWKPLPFHTDLNCSGIACSTWPMEEWGMNVCVRRRPNGFGAVLSELQANGVTSGYNCEAILLDSIRPNFIIQPLGSGNKRVSWQPLNLNR